MTEGQLPAGLEVYETYYPTSETILVEGPQRDLETSFPLFN
jgi:hypothetical protein